MTEPTITDNAAPEPRPWAHTFLADPFTFILIEQYRHSAHELAPGAQVERFRTWCEQAFAEPGRTELFWLAIARAQLDHKQLLVEVRHQALAAADKVFELVVWEDGPEFQTTRREQVARLKAELENAPASEDNLLEADRAWHRAVGNGMAKRHDLAYAKAKEGRERWPEDENFILLEAQALAFLDRPGEALEIARAALDRPIGRNTRFAYLHLLGKLHLFLERRDQSTGGRLGFEGAGAVKCLNEAQALVPGEPVTLRLLVETLMLIGKDKAALEAIEKLLRQNGEDPWLWKQKSVVLGSMGKRKESDEALTKSVFFGGDAESMARQGLAFLRKKKYEDAERCFRQALEMAPHYPWAVRLAKINQMAQKGGVTRWMIHQEINWAGRELWRYALFMGGWFGLIIPTAIVFPGENNPVLLWVICVSGAVMLAGLFLPGIWLWAARWFTDRESMKVERKAVAIKWNFTTTAQVVLGLVGTAVMFYFREKNDSRNHSAGGLFDGFEYFIGSILPLFPWLMTQQVLSNRRQKFSSLSKLDWLLLVVTSVSLAGFIPFIFTKAPGNPKIWIPAAAGAVGLVLSLGTMALREKPRKKR